jgi:hypothetical protein
VAPRRIVAGRSELQEDAAVVVMVVLVPVMPVLAVGGGGIKWGRSRFM